MNANILYVAFADHTQLAQGTFATVVGAVQQYVRTNPTEVVPLILDAVSSETIELDLRKPLSELVAQWEKSQVPPSEPNQSEIELTDNAKRSVGRPKLGVVAREITLLPRHWAWLNSQTGGASVALRKLVEQASRQSREKDRVRSAQESAYRFMDMMAGNLPQFEEATRALFANDLDKLQRCVQSWPNDVRNHALWLAQKVMTTDALPS